MVGRSVVGVHFPHHVDDIANDHRIGGQVEIHLSLRNVELEFVLAVGFDDLEHVGVEILSYNAALGAGEKKG